MSGSAPSKRKNIGGDLVWLPSRSKNLTTSVFVFSSSSVSLATCLAVALAKEEAGGLN